MSKKKSCDCVNQVNEQLAQFNTKLLRLMSFSMSDMTASTELSIETEKLDSKKRGKPKIVTPSYCPFCGVKL